MSASAAITGIGMLTPVGDCAAQTASSVRTGICRYCESAVHNRRFQPMTLALVPESALPPLAKALESVAGLSARQARMLQLAAPALSEACQELAPDELPPLFLSVPEPLHDRPAVSEEFLEWLALQGGRAGFDRQASELFPLGRAGGLHALAAAGSALAAGAPAAIVGGVDSHLDLRLLGELDGEGRVLAEGVMDGFCPGEGAAFLLLRPPSKVRRAALVHAPGFALEPGHRHASEPYRGDGLSEAIRQALATLEGVPVRSVLCSLNGESLGAKEWGVAAVRNRERLADPHRFEHPAEAFGDTGAAIAPLLLGIAALGLAGGWLEGPCLAWCSSEGAPRAGACVTLPQ